MKKRINTINESAKLVPRKITKGSEFAFTRQDYKKFMNEFLVEFAHDLISTGIQYNMPSRLGILQMIKYRPDYRIIDRVRTSILNKKQDAQGIPRTKVYATLAATDGYLPKLMWYKFYKSNFKNKAKYNLVLSRPNLRVNTYNKNHPKVNVRDFFKEKGYLIYTEKLNDKINNEQFD